MDLDNRSKYPDDELKELLGFVRFPRRKVKVTVEQADRVDASAMHGEVNTNPLPTPNKMFNVRVKVFDPIQFPMVVRVERGRMWLVYHSWRELLLWTFAHEIEHLRQIMRGDLEYSERRADRYATAVLDRYRPVSARAKA